MDDQPEILSVTPQRLRCYSCGTYSEHPDQWMYRVKLKGHSPVCPSCRATVEREIEQQSIDPNVAGALLWGALAAFVGSAAWYGIASVTDGEFGVLAIGIGWLVGKAVVRGSGDKRGSLLQAVAAALTVLAILGGKYLILNHAVRNAGIAGFSGWLTPGQFFAIYARATEAGNTVYDLIFIVIAIAAAYALPRSDRLAPEPPKKKGR